MTSRLRELSDEVRALEARLREGGGADKIDRQHRQGKLTARERVARLCDEGPPLRHFAKDSPHIPLQQQHFYFYGVKAPPVLS